MQFAKPYKDVLLPTNKIKHCRASKAKNLIPFFAGGATKLKATVPKEKREEIEVSVIFRGIFFSKY